jgi:TatA/E family protein of Tat protein translocase
LPTSLGPAEILVILVVALIVLGPKRLPEAGRQVGKAIAEVRKWSQGFQDEIKNVMDPPTTTKAPSYSDPQPGYQPPIPVIPAETPAPPDEGTVETTAAEATADEPAADVTVTTGSHGLVSGPAPTDPLGHIDASAFDYEPPGGEPPRT